MSRPVPFADDGSFVDQWQWAQQQGQDLAQLASAAAPEEGELPGQHCYQSDYDAAAAPDARGIGAAGGATYGDASCAADAYQRQLQEQYDAWPQQGLERRYAESYQQLQQQQYEQTAYPQHSYAQQPHATAAAAKAPQPGEERDFNPCDAWFGSWPGFCFKLGEQGLGYYRDKPLKPVASPTAAKAPEKAKPKVIMGNNSIVKGLAPKPGGVAKKKKPGEDHSEKPAYLREMEAWQKQSCSSDDRRRSLVK